MVQALVGPSTHRIYLGKVGVPQLSEDEWAEPEILYSKAYFLLVEHVMHETQAHADLDSSVII